MSRIHIMVKTTNKNKDKETAEEILEKIKEVDEAEYAESRIGIFDSARKRFFKYERIYDKEQEFKNKRNDRTN